MSWRNWLSAQVLDDPAQARQMVDEDKIAAAIIIPPAFSASIIPAGETGDSQPAVKLEMYANPSRPTSVGVIKTIVEEFINQVEIGRIGGQVTVAQLHPQRADRGPGCRTGRSRDWRALRPRYPRTARRSL